MPTVKHASRTVTGIWLGLIALAVVALAVLLLVFVPAYKRSFDEFGLRLPHVTRLAIHLSAFFQAFWWALVPALLLVCGGIPLLLRHVARARTLGNVFAAVALTTLLLTTALVVFSVAAPMAALQRGLSK